MEFTDSARALLKRLEGCRLTAYPDDAGVLTIGYGHTGDVKPGTVITQHQAEVVLDYDLRRFTAGVTQLLAAALRPISDLQFSALVLFAFNVGLTAFAGSTLLRDVLGGSYANVSAEFLRWIHVHDPSGVLVVDPILVARREAELSLWNCAAA